MRINGETHYLWRAVDDEGEVLDVRLQSRRNNVAALKFLRRTLKTHQATPRAVVTDIWQASMPAVRDVILNAENQVGKRLDNRIENSLQPTRRRERKLQRFKSAKPAQRFLSIFSAFCNRFNVQRQLISRKTMKMFRTDVLSCWRLAVSA